MDVDVHHQHAVGLAAGMAQRGAAGLHPAVAPVAVAQAILGVEMGRQPVDVIVETDQDRVAIVGMQQIAPVLDARHARIDLAEHALPARRELDRTTLDVPLPDAVVCPLDRQGIALLAFAQARLHFLALLGALGESVIGLVDAMTQLRQRGGEPAQLVALRQPAVRGRSIHRLPHQVPQRPSHPQLGLDRGEQKQGQGSQHQGTLPAGGEFRRVLQRQEGPSRQQGRGQQQRNQQFHAQTHHPVPPPEGFKVQSSPPAPRYPPVRGGSDRDGRQRTRRWERRAGQAASAALDQTCPPADARTGRRRHR